MKQVQKPIIFLIEDSLAYQIMIQRILEINGFTVFNFDNGKEASNMLLHVIPDLIITDIEMPIMDGFEFHKFVREHYSELNIPFIYLSSINTKKVRKKAMKLGAVSMLEKTITNKCLKENIDKALRVAV